MRQPRRKRATLLTVVMLTVIVLSALTVHTVQVRATIGTWNLVPISTPANSSLDIVNAVTAQDVWAAGVIQDQTGRTILMAHWNGSAWSTSKPFPQQSNGYWTPNPSGFAVITSSNIWMTGSMYGNGTGTVAFVAHWDGSSWQQVPTPDTHSPGPYLESIDALSATNIWAYGSTNGGNAPLIEHWDGNAWSIVPTPQSIQSVASPSLWSSCTTSDGNMWIEGLTSGHDWLLKTNGTSWSIVDGAGFYGIACSSPTDIWEDASYPAGTSTPLNHYDGSAWITEPSDNTVGYFSGITALSSTDVWVVGSTQSANNPTPQALIKHWDGTKVTTVSSPSIPGTRLSTLESVSAVNTNDVWAVGTAQDAQNANTPFIEHYTSIPPPSPTVTNTPSPTDTPLPIKPSGLWVNPKANGFSVTVGKSYTFKAYAYPTHQGDPAIAHVNFTVSWPGHPGYVDLCGDVTQHTKSNVYACTTDFSKVNGGLVIPQGTLTVTFNVTDVKGNVNNASNGSHTGTIITRAGGLLLAPFPKGIAFSILNGYGNPAIPDCPKGYGHDHCGNQLFGFDLKPTPVSYGKGDYTGGTIIAPVSGYISWEENGCLGIDTGSKKNPSHITVVVCHFSAFHVAKDSPVLQGKDLGLSSDSWVHISVDNRSSSPYQPMAFTGSYLLEHQAFVPDHDSSQGIKVIIGSKSYYVDFNEYGLSQWVGTSSNNLIK